MSQKITIGDQEVEVFTAEEHMAALAGVRGEFEPKLTKAEQERERLSGLLDARGRELSGQEAKFKRLSDEQVAKLDEKDLIIYNNQLFMADQNKKIADADTKAYENAVDAAIRARVGTDANLFTKVKEMYGLINLEDVTQEQVATKVAAAFGAIGVTAPDLLASAGFSGGGFAPPTRETGGETFADSERGKDLAKFLGIGLTEEEVKRQLNRG